MNEGGRAHTRWTAEASGRASTYDDRWTQMAAEGQNVHGEVDLVRTLVPPGASVLDAGCGTGRVALELARRGFDTVGVDNDTSMLERARAKSGDGGAGVTWAQADLATLDLGRQFDLVVMAGNVMIFLAPGSEAAAVRACAAHLVPGGLLVAGFQLQAGRLDLDSYDRFAADAGLHLAERWATWDRAPFAGPGSPTADYAVSVHRLT